MIATVVALPLVVVIMIVSTAISNDNANHDHATATAAIEMTNDAQYASQSTASVLETANAAAAHNLTATALPLTATAASNIVATQNALNLYLGDWQPTSASIPIGALRITSAGANHLNVSFSVCFTLAGLCSATSSDYNASNIPFRPDGLTLSVAGMDIVIVPGGGRLNVSFTYDGSTSRQTFTRTLSFVTIVPIMPSGLDIPALPTPASTTSP